MAALVDHLSAHAAAGRDRVTPHRLRTTGTVLGMSYGIETVHWFLDHAWAAPGELRETFLYHVMARTGFLYPLQEYCFGEGRPTAWAAQREYDR